ncbi:MAG: hypothetical protein DDT22_00607 [candidate division WS2 bacterium]|nr:hypothetical protein [Candidatus Lithacetigena glycinireducens]
MSKENCLFTFYTLTSLHAGAGESAQAIDLPVQREKHTEYPVVYSSGIKGSLRYHFAIDPSLNKWVDEIFGKEGTEANESRSGKVVFTDAKILLFPVRSSEGVFKWITCPFVINRLKRDLDFINIKLGDVDITIDNFNGVAFRKYEDKIVLEDFQITVKEYNTLQKPILVLFQKITSDHLNETDLVNRLIIVSDDVFKTLVTVATQIIARNVLDDDTKKSKNLWYEEVVPSDAVFYTIMKSAFNGNQEVIGKLVSGLSGNILQIGGNETIGYGFVRMSENLVNTFTNTEE